MHDHPVAGTVRFELDGIEYEAPIGRTEKGAHYPGTVFFGPGNAFWIGKPVEPSDGIPSD